MSRETLFTLAILFAVFGHPSHADSIADALMAPYTDPCLDAVLSQSQFNASVIGDATGLYPLYMERRESRCGHIPTLDEVAMLAYVPRDAVFHWDQPPLLPSPVPLPGAGLMMLAALLLLMKLTHKRIPNV